MLSVGPDAASFASACHYLDWTVANYGSVAISQTFLVRLLVDGLIVREWPVNGLNALTYTPLTDFPVYLAAGTHQLDMNYTVFGKVIDGRAVINAIAAQPTDSTNDRPLTPIVMEKVEVVAYSARQLLADFGFTVDSP